MPLWRLLALLAAVAVVTALLVLWLGGSIGTIPGAAGREADGAKPVNEGALELVTRPDLHPASVTVTLGLAGRDARLLLRHPGQSRATATPGR